MALNEIWIMLLSLHNTIMIFLFLENFLSNISIQKSIGCR